MEVGKELRNRRVQMEKGAPYILNKAQKERQQWGNQLLQRPHGE